ncbi:HD domain-containing protein [[Clostridium] aminophilum]|uniref:Exopolyphosphatase / guanosine-5'-triphosphate,3'-diphosphate pyrophosphatase n=1 Tax=[Clostridium] aminophilum TaxID=1526 RepID=A0A1I6ICD5_9FIRM|nr:HD domain-containing protein [[Clostridium] aminophilum]MCR4628333.1 HD domain-containing protein [Clostridium sp.]SFR64445.1 exopolyphosphatase / guanosine-5'-triphosphate,3'-diphosphate pyrophosphatase [[Clostridium] aminophilum]
MKMFAAIDVGSFDTEIAIYEISEEHGIRKIDHVRRQLTIGRDTYNDGKISLPVMRELIRVLEQFRERMDGYHVEDYRAYAASALREATNSRIILDQIRNATGLQVHTINNSELRFMTHKALALRSSRFDRGTGGRMAVMDVGFGSSQLSLFEDGVLVSTQNLSLGVLRIAEMSSHWKTESRLIPDIEGELMDKELATYRDIYLGGMRVETLIATGESINNMVLRGMKEKPGKMYTAAEFGEFCRRISHMTEEEIAEFCDISGAYARVMIPSAVLYEKVLELTGAGEVWVGGVTLCDGIAADYAEEQKLVRFRHDFADDALSAAGNMSVRYKGDRKHIAAVEKAAMAVFDILQEKYGLNSRSRLLLRLAAILHDCGKYVSITRETLSSYQIIMSTELIGISHLEREIVANVVRYNTRDFVYDEIHLESDLSQYDGLAKGKSEIVLEIAKLAAILRLANAVDRSHRQKLKDLEVRLEDGTLVMETSCEENLTLEQFSMEQKAEFFEEIYGIQPVLQRKRR